MKGDESKRNWDSVEDEIDWIKFEIQGIAELSRKYLIDGEYKKKQIKDPDTNSVYYDVEEGIIAAKGITAFLSYDNISNYGHSLRGKLNNKYIIDLEDKIFPVYYKKCFKFLTEDNRKELFEHNKKTKTELIEIHIKNEKQLFNESQLIFDEFDEWEIPTINQIEKAASYYQDWLEKSLNNILHSTQKKKKLNLIDFFNEEISEKTINKIKSEFKDYDGKRMAILIYLLQSDYKIITVISNSKVQSRISFVRLLKENDNISNISSINKVFDTNTDNLSLYDTDAEFIDFKEKLSQILK